MKFQEYFKEYRIVVFGGLNCEDIVFDVQVESEKRNSLLYHEVTHHYHVINSVMCGKQLINIWLNFTILELEMNFDNFISVICI